MSRFLKLRLLSAFSAALIFSVLSASSQAQTAARITEPVDDKVLAVIPHTVHPYAIAANDQGRVDSSLPMQRMLLLFKPSEQQAAALKQLLDRQHDTASVNYQKWLSPEAFAAQFGPSDGDLKLVSVWLAQQGFAVEKVARGRHWLEFSGTAGQVERSLHTEIHHYLVKGEPHIANASDISLPRALTPVVAGIVTLHDFKKQSQHQQVYGVHRDPTSGKLEPDLTVTTTNGTHHYLAPGDYARIYNTEPLLKSGIDGSGLSIAIVGRTDIELSDVQTFRQIFGLSANDPHFIVNGQDPGVTGDELESDLDVEWAGAVAPNATINFVATASTFTTDGVDLSASYIVDNVVSPIMSTSYGQCERFLGPVENAFYSTLYQQAAAEGITALVSSGDNGGAGCDYPTSYGPAQYGLNVNGLASTPYNLAVGGTSFNENGQDSRYWQTANRSDLSSALGYIPEIVWNETCDPTIDPNHCGDGYYSLYASSGGASSCSLSTVTNGRVTCLGGYAKPSWQVGKGVPSDHVRDLPDLAMAAAGGHDGYLVCIEGSCQTTTINGKTVLTSAAVVGGTSAAAPSMAGMLALVEQKNGSFQGLANYKVYQLASTESLVSCNSSKMTDPTKSNNCIFHDVNAGNNTVPGQTGFAAGPGYDKATGLGTVNAANLVGQWSAAQKLNSSSSISSWSTTAQHGQPINLSLTVAPSSGSGSPSGDFSLATQSGSVFGGTINNGNFLGNIFDLPGGSYSMSAHYTGDAMFNPSSSNSLNVQITPEPATIKVSPYVINLAGYPVPIYGPLTYGQPMAFQFDVKGSSGIGSPSGSVTIDLDNTIALGTFPLNQGGTGWTQVDTLQKTGLLTGNHTYNVTYNGDNSFSAAKAKTIAVSVEKGWPQSITFPSPGDITVGAPLRLLIAVGGEGVQIPTGTIQLYDNRHAIGNPIPLLSSGELGQNLAQAIASPSLAVGPHTLQATYSGDSKYRALTINDFFSGHAFVNVNPAVGDATIIQLQQSSPAVELGKSDTYSVTVRSTKTNSPTPTGKVYLGWENGATLAGPRALVNGSATFTVPWYFAGDTPIAAVYSGDSRYTAFSSTVIVTVVKPATPKVSLQTASLNVPANTETSLMASVVGKPANTNLSAPYGQVQFFDSVNGSSPHALGFPQYLTNGNGGNPVFTLPTLLPSGDNVITVRYLGSSDWTPASSNAITVTVQ